MATEKVGTSVLELKVDDRTYNAALDKDEARAKQIDKTFAQVTSDIAKNAQQVATLTSKLFGDDVIQRAHQYATAVQAVGGVATLSAKQQKAAFDSVTQAIDILKARGQSIPESFKNLASATKPIEDVPTKLTLAQKATDALKGSLVQLASGFALGNLITGAANALVSWGKDAFDAAGKTVDMANKTGLSTEAIQRMAFVAKQTGTELETFTNAAFKLGTQLATGSGNTRKAVEALGLSFDDLKKKSPDQQFDAIVAALERMENPQERNRIAVELFGKAAKDILPSIADGYTEIANQANVASDAQIRALDAAGDALDRFISNRKADLTAALGGLVLAGEGAGKIGFANTIGLLLQQGPLAGQILSGIGAEAANAGKKAKDIFLATPEIESYVTKLKEAEATYRNLSRATLEEVRAAQKLGLSNEEIINQFSDKGITEGVLKLITEGTQQLKKEQGEAAREAKKLSEAQEELASASTPLVGQQRELVAWLLKRNASESDIVATLGVTKTQVKEVAEVEKVRTEALKVADKQAQEFVANQRKAMDATAKAITDSVQAVLEWNDKLALQGTSGLNRELIQIEQSRKAALAAIQNVGETESEITKRRRAQINEFYDHQRDLATGTASTIVERLHNQGILTRSELRQQADAFRRDYEQMRASGLYTVGQLQEAWNRWHEAEKKLQGDSIAGWLMVGAAIQNLARQIPGLGGQIVGQIGGAITAQANFAKASEDYNSKLKHTVGETAAYITNSASLVLGYFQMAKGILEQLSDELSGMARLQAITQRGGESAVRAAGITAGVNPEPLIAARSTSQFKAQLLEFDRAVAENNARLQRYGLTWKDLGENIKRANIEAMTRQLIADSRAFYLQGLDFDKRVKAMSSGLNQLVIDAVQTGQKIPKALQPMLETLIKSKGLSEDAAKALLGMADDGAPSFDEIKAAAERYGIEISKLGPKINQLRINDIAKQIIADWTLLQRAGADTGVVLDGMKKDVQDVVTEALKAGLKIPEGMRPIIEAMARAGLLTDEFGNKLEDTSRLEFEKPLTDAIDDLIKKLDELIDHFSKVGDAAEEGFGRAGAAGAQATGEVAVPRGQPPSSGTATSSGTAAPPTQAPSDQTGTPTGTPPPGATGPSYPSSGPTDSRQYGVPRNGVTYIPPGTPIVDANGNVVGVTGTTTNPRYRFKRGGVAYASEGGWRQFAASEAYGWRRGVDVIPTMMAVGEAAINADVGMPRLTPEGVDALNTGAPLPPKLLPKLFDSSALRTAAMVGSMLVGSSLGSHPFALGGLSMERPAPYRSTVSASATPGPEHPVSYRTQITNDFRGSYIDSEHTVNALTEKVAKKLPVHLRRNAEVRTLWRTPLKGIVESGL